MYLLPSMSQAKGPLTLSKTIGCPPTDLKALTGELTPPGINSWAEEKISSDLVRFNISVTV